MLPTLLPVSRFSRQSAVRWIATTLSALVLTLAAAADASAQIRNVIAAWDANNDGLTAGYHVLVGTAPNAPLVVLDVGRASSVGLPLPIGNRYYVAVRGYTAQGALGPSTPESVVDLASRPGPPAGLRVDVVGPRATLRWSESATGGVPSTYLLSVGTAPGAANLLANVSLGNVNAVSGDLPPGTYYVRLQGANVVGVGPASETSFQVGGGYRPGPPTNLRARWQGSTVVLSWSPPAGEAITSYVLEAGTAAGASNVGAVNVGNTTSLAVPVPPGTFHVRVRAVNARGVSDPSSEIIVQR